MHEIAGRLIFREGIPELLCDPARGRTGRNVHVDDASPVMGEDNQHEQQAERDRRHNKEVGGHDLARVVREKCWPRL